MIERVLQWKLLNVKLHSELSRSSRFRIEREVENYSSLELRPQILIIVKDYERQIINVIS